MIRYLKNWRAYRLQLITKMNHWLFCIVRNEKDRIQTVRRMFYWEKNARDNLNALNTSARLTDAQKKEIRDFFAPYQACKTLFHAFYYAATGVYDVRFIPDDLYYAFIDPFYNNWAESVYIDNKTYYSTIFHDVLQPETVAFRSGGLWFDAQNRHISSGEAVSRCLSTGEVFLKQATESEGGHGVYCVSSRAEIEAAIEQISGDIVIQKPLKQHAELARLNAASVNTVRILSLLSDSGVKVYSSLLRMGLNGSRVDNVSSGGITCGIESDGRLKKTAYAGNGTKYDRHPTSGVEFDSIVVPRFSDAVALVKSIHKRIPHFKLVSWDVAIREDGEPVLLEMNIHYGEIDIHQLNNGPLFGADTESILREVFRSER